MGKDSGSGAKVHWNQTNLAYSVITIGVPMGEEGRAKPCFCLGSRSLGCAGLKGELRLHIAELRGSSLNS